MELESSAADATGAQSSAASAAAALVALPQAAAAAPGDAGGEFSPVHNEDTCRHDTFAHYALCPVAVLTGVQEVAWSHVVLAHGWTLQASRSVSCAPCALAVRRESCIGMPQDTFARLVTRSSYVLQRTILLLQRLPLLLHRASVGAHVPIQVSYPTSAPRRHRSSGPPPAVSLLLHLPKRARNSA